MPRIAEEAFGVLTVFAQTSDAQMNLDAVRLQAKRFFQTDLELRREGDLPSLCAVVSAPTGEKGTRRCAGRPVREEDLRAAEQADLRAGYTGLSELAKRCKYVWRVVREEIDDRPALLFAAILGSVVLGPILSADEDELFGIKTARLKLARPRS